MVASDDRQVDLIKLIAPAKCFKFTFVSRMRTMNIRVYTPIEKRVRLEQSESASSWAAWSLFEFRHRRIGQTANEKKCERLFRCEKTLQSIKYNCSPRVVCADIVKIKCPCCSHVYVEWETDGVHVWKKMHTCRLRNLYSSLFFLCVDSRCCAVLCFRFTCISSQTARSVVRLTPVERRDHIIDSFK